MFLTISLAIVDTRSSSFDAPSKRRLSRGRQHDACYVFGLCCWAQWHWYFTHFKFLFSKRNRIRIKRFNTNTRIVTPLVICHFCSHWSNGNTFIYKKIYIFPNYSSESFFLCIKLMLFLIKCHKFIIAFNRLKILSCKI